MGKNIKDGDRVYYKIQSGTIRTGKYQEKTKSVKLANGTIAKPPMVALFKQKSTAEKNPFVKLAAGKVGYEEPEKPKKGRPAGKKTAAEKIKGDKRRKTGKYATEKKETPKPANEELSDAAKEKKEDFIKYGQGVGKRVSFRGKVNKSNPEKTRITVGVIEGFTDKGIVMKADKGKVSKEGADRKTGTVNYSRTQIVWTPTSGTTKKVVPWSKAKRGPESGGKGGKIILDTIGG